MVEQKEIVGKLLAQGEAFDMLDLYPVRHTGFSDSPIPFSFQKYIFEFLVVVDGFAQTIIVSQDGFVIIPYLIPPKKEVNYLVDEKEEAYFPERDIEDGGSGALEVEPD